MGDDPLRELTRGEVEAYDRDGVVCARGLFGADWVERMARAVDRIVANPTYYGGQVSIDGKRFSGDLFVWKLDDDFSDFVYESPGAQIANMVLRSTRVNFFYDQLFVKPPGCHVPTPWHHERRLLAEPVQGAHGPLFPQILPHPIPQEGPWRAQGHEPPDPSSMNSVLEGVRAYMGGRSRHARA